MTFMVCLLCSSAVTSAYQIPQPATKTTTTTSVSWDRRDVLLSFVTTTAATAVLTQDAAPAYALSACPPKSQNCILTTWTPPPSAASSTKAYETIKSVLESYPQAGQANIDLGGWKIVEEDASAGTLRVEYTSGIGTFAKFFNGGKPFVDDLRVQVVVNDNNGGVAVQIRSNSRVGDSDLGVNQKRLVYLANAISKLGWTTPEITY